MALWNYLNHSPRARDIVVFANDKASGFCKAEIGKIDGLKAYLPEEWHMCRLHMYLKTSAAVRVFVNHQAVSLHFHPY